MTETTESDQRRKTKRRKGPPAKKRKPPTACWLCSSPQYLEFAALCDKKKWKTRLHLPRRGAKEAKELDAFMLRGLDNGVSLTRTQANRKFKHWKESFASERKMLQLDASKIETEHTPTCPTISTPPAEGEVDVRECVVKRAAGDDNTFIWHWCSKCACWKKHSTADHDSASNVVTVEDEDDDSSVNSVYDEDGGEGVDEHCAEMQNVIYSVEPAGTSIDEE